MEEGYFDYAYFSRCNEGCGGGAEAIEDAGYGLAGPEFVEDGVDGGDDEDGRDGEGDDGCDAAQDAGGEVAGVGGHVDAQGPGQDSATAIMLAMSDVVYQPVRWPMSVMKGRAARPPPMAKRPVLMNSQMRLK